MLRKEAKRGIALDLDDPLRQDALQAVTRYRAAHPTQRPPGTTGSPRTT